MMIIRTLSFNHGWLGIAKKSDTVSCKGEYNYFLYFYYLLELTLSSICQKSEHLESLRQHAEIAY